MDRSDQSPHRPSPARPQPSTVLAEPATPEACADDYDQRGGLTVGQVAATPHTHGRK
jgi:hypothetical protein